VLVSIVTPSFQQARYLGETIRSVITQDHPDIEYAVVDGGSTDGSVDVIRGYADRLAWWVSEPDRGQTHAIRKGWDRARGEVLAYLNADDTYLPGAVRRAAAAFESDPGAVVVFGNCDLVDEVGGEVRRMPTGPATLADVLARRTLIPQPAAFVRADAVREIDGPDEALHYAMDFDLWIRLLVRGSARFIGGPPLGRFRWHPASKSGSADEPFSRELLAILDRFYSRPDVPPAARRVRRRAYAEADLAGARAALRRRGGVAAAARWLLRAAGHDPIALVDAVARRIQASMGHLP
jgi:glycosyltransferase involved in cell wall biosynthesis